MKTRKYLWGKFVWNIFDFASDGRNEGDTPGRNDKGLVTYDRATRKDAFYWYKANWSNQPTVYITERRYNPHPSGDTTVRVYSNLPQIELKLNGASQGVQTSDDHIFSFNIKIPPRTRTFVEACGNASSGSVCDSVSWTACRRSILGPDPGQSGRRALHCRAARGWDGGAPVASPFR
jgi:beta-galactosidase